MTEHRNMSAIELVPDNRDAGKAINGVIVMSLQQGARCERTSEQFNPSRRRNHRDNAEIQLSLNEKQFPQDDTSIAAPESTNPPPDNDS